MNPGLPAAGAGEPAAGHSVPADKNLDPEWGKTLFARGDRKAYQGKELETIGMPCGGICAGQLYVRGDGTLARWWIANNAYKTSVPRPDHVISTPLGEHQSGYRTYRPASHIDQGFSPSGSSSMGQGQWSERSIVKTSMTSAFSVSIRSQTIEYRKQSGISVAGGCTAGGVLSLYSPEWQGFRPSGYGFALYSQEHGE